MFLQFNNRFAVRFILNDVKNLYDGMCCLADVIPSLSLCV